MKKIIFLTCLMALAFVSKAEAKKKPVIQFEQTTIDLGTFTQKDPVHTVTFKFKNVGKSKLVINYVNTSCGCTDAQYPKDFISPGGTGEITVTYNGKDKMPGRFRKVISVYTNNGKDLTRLYIEGNMKMVQQEKGDD